MTSAAAAADQSARDVVRSRPVKVGARLGILAYGVTHVLIGVLALQVALGGGGGGTADQNGAFRALAQQPFGRLLLWVLAVGFVATALWRLEQAVWGYTYEPDRTRMVGRKASSAAEAAVFLVLAVLAGTTAAGGGGGGGGQQKATAGVLGLPGGQFLVGAAGVIVVAMGGRKVYQGWKKKFLDDMSLPSDVRARQVAERTGQVGFIAKGASVALIGALVVVAAVRFRPDEASGLDAALKALATQPFGPYLLSLVALGLVAYGVFCVFDARYHRV